MICPIFAKKKYLMKIEKDKVVLMNYTLTDDAGDKIGSTIGQGPMAYIQGMGNILPALEIEMEGKQAGDKFTVNLLAENAYGKHNPDLIHVVEKNVFQGDEKITIGMRVNVQSSNGDTIAVVTAFDDKTISLDLNHPLADKNLTFNIEVTEVREPTAVELDHGHVHGTGGHQH
jgi:FKBP-type peptidyl-prolyl cis-trans isomerase SlyD